MNTPFVTPKLLNDVRDELAGIYSNSGIEDRTPAPEEVVRSALVEIATDLRLDADAQGGCDKVDECTAGALVRYRLADWLTVASDARNTGENAGTWQHCSPALLNSGVHCATTPRRPCECPFVGSHDHLVAS